MNGARLGVGAQSVGLAEAAYREAVKYAQEREQFGKPIANFAQVYEMLGNMRAKTDAIRTLLYETARQVDMYKSLDAISRERKITPEEKQLLKAHSRLADALTPMLKLFSSEYANQIAYDCIQVHGGSGFMKDYACERLYRDARILTIYEGTSQLQVVAAIKGVTSGVYANRIKEYETVEVSGELAEMRKTLVALRERYEATVEKAKELGSASEAFDFLSRRLVEMAGYLIMSNLLVNDSQKEAGFIQSARIMTQMAQSEIEKAACYIDNFNPDILQDYKACL